jgi:hypothetical protein
MTGAVVCLGTVQWTNRSQELRNRVDETRASLRVARASSQNHAGAKLLARLHHLKVSFVLEAHAGKSVTSRKTGSLTIEIKAPVRKHR